MSAPDIEQRFTARLEAAGVRIDAGAVTRLGAYLALLARWNRRINLTAFNLDAPTDHALDRLIVEPVVAAAVLRDDDRIAIDIGSGGGSPALPLKIVRPHLRMTLVEARVRKSAFLREAVRELALDETRVETFHLDRSGHFDMNGTADLVTMRAVRADAPVFDGVAKLLRPEGRLLWFTEGVNLENSQVPPGWFNVPLPNGPSFLWGLARV